jgi:hypothetical protein
MLPLLDDVGNVKRGRLGAFLAFHGATPSDRSQFTIASANFRSGPSVQEYTVDRTRRTKQCLGKKQA